ncbi:MAG: prepilin-type N-terminal cleavage/methylation domain-containing protein [Acidobacteriota bacterium]
MNSLPPSNRPRAGTGAGFSLLELIIVISIIGILATIALPNLIQMPRRADEAVLRTNLRTLRTVIDQHNSDKGFYPPSLETLVEDGYLRAMPIDPITESTEWGIEIEETDPDAEPAETDVSEEGGPGIIDVYSLSEDVGLDGTAYAEW